jgi:hypothetical protein
VVSLPSAGIAHRSSGRARRRFPLCGPLLSAPPFPFLRAHLICLDSPVLEHPSDDRIVVGDGRPATTRATVSPWTAVAGPPSSVGHRVCAIEFARLRWSAW